MRRARYDGGAARRHRRAPPSQDHQPGHRVGERLGPRRSRPQHGHRPGDGGARRAPLAPLSRPPTRPPATRSRRRSIRETQRRWISRALSAPAASALGEVLRRDAEVRDGITALWAGRRPRHGWRTRSHRTAALAGVRAALCVALASAFFVLAGWPSTDVALSLAAVIIGLGATTPNHGLHRPSARRGPDRCGCGGGIEIPDP
jgi:hypothetical protein